MNETITIKRGQDFLRVFKLPKYFPSDFCFGGGHSVNFQLVNWINVLPPKVWDTKERVLSKEVVLDKEDHDLIINALKHYLASHDYVKEGRQYLVITKYDYSFLFTIKDKDIEAEKEAFEVMNSVMCSKYGMRRG